MRNGLGGIGGQAVDRGGARGHKASILEENHSKET